MERECYAAAVVVKAIEAGALAPGFVHTDLKTFPAEIFRGCFDGMVGGYPCQPFSTAGRREGSNDSKGRNLWPYFKRTIELVRPGFCFFENVEGHVTLGLKDVCHNLGELGYEYSAGLFSAEECGAPHQRKRIFILARQSPKARSSNELANTDGSRRAQDSITSQLRAAGPFESSSYCWPSRPGQTQQEWEASRLVGNSDCHDRFNECEQDPGKEEHTRAGDSGSGMVDPSGQRLSLGESGAPAESGAEQKSQRSGGEGECETFAGLGGSIDGPDNLPQPAASYMGPAENRIDRLRMLGNGVIAHTAAKAFLTLWNELER